MASQYEYGLWATMDETKRSPGPLGPAGQHMKTKQAQVKEYFPGIVPYIMPTAYLHFGVLGILKT